MEIECQYRGVTKADEGVVFWITVLPPDPPLSWALFAGGASGIAASIDLTSGASSKGCSTDWGWDWYPCMGSTFSPSALYQVYFLKSYSINLYEAKQIHEFKPVEV